MIFQNNLQKHPAENLGSGSSFVRFCFKIFLFGFYRFLFGFRLFPGSCLQPKKILLSLNQSCIIAVEIGRLQIDYD
jgi:hypothetical protein